MQYGKKKKFKASIWQRKSKTVFIHRQCDPVHKKSFVESTESKQNQLDLAIGYKINSSPSTKKLYFYVSMKNSNMK